MSGAGREGGRRSDIAWMDEDVQEFRKNLFREAHEAAKSAKGSVNGVMVAFSHAWDTQHRGGEDDPWLKALEEVKTTEGVLAKVRILLTEAERLDLAAGEADTAYDAGTITYEQLKAGARRIVRAGLRRIRKTYGNEYIFQQAFPKLFDLVAAKA